MAFAHASFIQSLGGFHMVSRLSSTMTVREFENGYWYLDELKDFEWGHLSGGRRQEPGGSKQKALGRKQ